MTLLTLFTAPKPFTNPHISLIQRNALRSWKALGDQVEVVMIGDEPGMADVALELGIRHISQVETNDLGTPLLSSIFALGRGVNDSPFLAYVNADIVLFPDLIENLENIAAQKKKFLIAGERWDLAVKEPIVIDDDCPVSLLKILSIQGKLHGKYGSDYFIYPRDCFTILPEFAVGRAGWDNWMIFHARQQRWAVIDATDVIKVVHQDHDYSHLPGGQRHYKLPETDVNVKLAGGKRSIFTLKDASHYVDGKKVKKKKLTWHKFWREVEIFPLVRLRSHSLGWVTFAIFHPKKAYAELRTGLISPSNR